MPISSSILVYGSDPMLMETRAWLLESAGFEVFRSKELSEAIYLLSANTVGLLIVCHSVATRDCQSLLEGSESRPGLKKLLMTANTEICPKGRAERQISAFAGPQALIAAVRTILATSTTSAEPASPGRTDSIISN